MIAFLTFAVFFSLCCFKLSWFQLGVQLSLSIFFRQYAFFRAILDFFFIHSLDENKLFKTFFSCSLSLSTPKIKITSPFSRISRMHLLHCFSKQRRQQKATKKIRNRLNGSRAVWAILDFLKVRLIDSFVSGIVTNRISLRCSLAEVFYLNEHFWWRILIIYSGGQFEQTPYNRHSSGKKKLFSSFYLFVFLFLSKLFVFSSADRLILHHWIETKCIFVQYW